jgi:predicted negative regulator of RcsB-dependent stress response
MADLETDDEKVESIKRWWKANGVSVVAGVVLGLGAVFGWRAWVGYQDGVRQRASIAFEQLLASMPAAESEQVASRASALQDEYGSTPYAMLADLTAAKAHVEAGNLSAAGAALRSAIADAPDPGLKRLAALRLARVLIAQGDLEQASSVIAEHDDGGAFGGDFATLRGDIALSQGRIDDARNDYRRALELDAGNRRLIDLKLQDLPPEGTS